MEKFLPLHDPDLRPLVYQPPGCPDEQALISIDACILLARDGITPKAKRVYKLYLKFRRQMARRGLTGEKMRSEAFFAALEASGARIERIDLTGKDA